jgi:uncharacterized protein DUF4259
VRRLCIASKAVTQSGFVGAWDSGPFDNDDAADFAGELDDAGPGERVALIRRALQAAVDATAEDDDDLPRGVAAAAVLAAVRVDTPVDSSYAPKFLADEDSVLEVPDDLIELAVQALDAVAESDSEYAELFGESGTLETLRSALTM